MNIDVRTLLNEFTREELMTYARSVGVKLGKNKTETITNIVESGKYVLKTTIILHDQNPFPKKMFSSAKVIIGDQND